MLYIYKIIYHISYLLTNYTYVTKMGVHDEGKKSVLTCVGKINVKLIVNQTHH